MKKLLIVCLVIFSTFALFSACANDTAHFQVIPLPDGESIRITDYTGEAGRVRIPARVNNVLGN